MHTFKLMWAMLLWLHATFIHDLHAAKIIKVSYDWPELVKYRGAHFCGSWHTLYCVKDSNILTVA